MPFFESFREIQIRPETVQVQNLLFFFTFQLFLTLFNCFCHFSTVSDQLEPVLAITKDGIENTFREITVITTIRCCLMVLYPLSSEFELQYHFRKDKLFTMVKAYGSEFKRTLVYDRIKEDLRIFCANNTIDDVYNVKFLDIVEQVKDNVKTSISRLGEVVIFSKHFGHDTQF